MAIFLLAFIGTLIVMVILCVGRLAFGRTKQSSFKRFINWFVRYFIFNYLVSLFILYFWFPALTGPFWGWTWVLWPLLFSGIIHLAGKAASVSSLAEALRSGRSSSRTSNDEEDTSRRKAIATGILSLFIVALLGLIVPFFITVFTTWFDVNAKALAAIPTITIQKNENLPPTDEKHIVLVSQSVAAYEGQQVLGSTGQNLGSAYNIAKESYTLQSISGHLYYVGELSYNNIFANLSSWRTPGFVVVDAENPQAVPVLYTDEKHPGSSIAVLPGGLLNQDLLRHVYLSGYNSGRLLDPTLELDDQFHPYWTVSLMQPTRGYVGDTLNSVLLVDANTGEIKQYAPQDVPKWVDRVMPTETVQQYLEWWGLYHDAAWFNPSGQGQQRPASSPILLYNQVDQPVWMVPMTSASASNNSSTGFFLFDTYKNQATFYPLSGIGIGDNVKQTLESTRANIRGYKVDSVQLYQIYGVPTWVAIYVQVTDSGDIFQAVGLVDAKELNGSNVQFENTLPQALLSYQKWLSDHKITGGEGAPTVVTKNVTGKVLRISPILQNGNTIFYIQIEGQNAIFTAELALSPKLPLVQVGDTIKVEYVESSESVIAVKAIDDLTIQIGASATPTPTPIITPTATATANP